MLVTLPNVGDRVRVIRPLEVDPNDRVDVGAEAEIVSVTFAAERKNRWENGFKIVLRFLTEISALKGFDNCYSFYPECGPMTHHNGFDLDPLAQFHQSCEFVNVGSERREVQI